MDGKDIKPDNIFCYPRFEIVKVSSDKSVFSGLYSLGSFGITYFLQELMREFHKKQIPATTYLYGKGVISNEYSKNFNTENKGKPDLLVCKNAINPVFLADVKYASNVDKFDKLGELIVCDVDKFELYLKESKKIGCPVYIIRIAMLPNNEDEFNLFGIKLSEKLVNKMNKKSLGFSNTPAYCLKMESEEILEGDDLFDELANLMNQE